MMRTALALAASLAVFVGVLYGGGNALGVWDEFESPWTAPGTRPEGEMGHGRPRTVESASRQVLPDDREPPDPVHEADRLRHRPEGTRDRSAQPLRDEPERDSGADLDP